MRYVGQGYEVEVPVSGMHENTAELARRLEVAFERRYAELYGRTEKNTPAEIVSWRVVVFGPTPELTPKVAVEANHDAATSRDQASAARTGSRRIYCLARRGFVDALVYDRYRLVPGASLIGPAIIEERESTVVVPDGAAVSVDQYRNLLIDLPLETDTGAQP